MADAKKRLVIGVTGASGSILALDLLQELRRLGSWETHVVITDSAKTTMEHELPNAYEKFQATADCIYSPAQIDGSIASGTFLTSGMVIIPCSMKTLAGITSGYSDNLLLRAADVTLKEHRPLILCVRETPFSTIHLRNMYELSQMGVRIIPAVINFYSRPQTVQDIIRHNTGKILDVFGQTAEQYHRWTD